MAEVQHDRAVLTIAFGRELYVRMACSLARSFLLWNRGNGIRFVLATDRPDLVPSDLSEIDVMQVEPGAYGRGFSAKLHLDSLCSAEQTLFIDSDCLVLGSLASVFDRFESRAVSAVGTMRSDGEWCGDIAQRCQSFGIAGLPVFVGAVYYLSRGALSRTVFETARRLEQRYDEIGLVRLRGIPNEEPLLSLSMALHEQSPIPDDGTIRADAMNFNEISVDVFRGRAHFAKTSDLRQIACTLSAATPVIAHFNDSFSCQSPYTDECERLEKVSKSGWPIWLASLYATVRHRWPSRTAAKVKTGLRPLYHRLFGVRSVARNPRL